MGREALRVHCGRRFDTLPSMENKTVDIIGGGLAGCEAALQLAQRGVRVRLFEMRPGVETPVHSGGGLAELVCSNSLKSTKPESAAGMLKAELAALGSHLLACARECSVPAGGALAVDREAFSSRVGSLVEAEGLIEVVRGEVRGLEADGSVVCDALREDRAADAVIVASGPLTSDALAGWLEGATGEARLAFYDAAAPIVMADSLDMGKLFSQSRYKDAGTGDYLNAPFSKEEYERFIGELVGAERVIAKDFETRELFQACQPIEEIARKGIDAPRFGPLKPVGLRDPRTGHRPWAALQLRAEDAHGESYNLVGFQTNLTFGEQKRVFRMIPGLEEAEFARYGVMHRNTFVEAPRLLDRRLRMRSVPCGVPVFMAGQVSGTEGYCEAIMSGLHAALCAYACLHGKEMPDMPADTAFGALLAYACDPGTVDYQPMHVNFGIMPPLEERVRNKRDRYAAYASRGAESLAGYVEALEKAGIAAPGGGGRR